MSGQQPPRRRRIAGERRGMTPVTPTPVETGHGPVETELSRPTSPAPTAPAAVVDPQTERAAHEARTEGWWGSRASLVVLAAALALLLVVTGLGLAGLLGNRGLAEIREASAVREAEQTAPSVAERAAEAILAYDYRTLDAEQDEAERFMTPAFVEKYSTSFDKFVKPAARTYKAQVTAEVLGSSVVRATPDRVKVLVFVDQKTVATNKQNPQVALNRVEFDMVLRGGSWLVDDITSY